PESPRCMGCQPSTDPTAWRGSRSPERDSGRLAGSAARRARAAVSMSTRRRDRTGLRTLTTVVAERRTLPRGVAFWVAGAIALVAFAANKAVSPLYRVYQAEFRFSATTL